ncbi:hypothetical protein evm_012966 [Chilo suppressalis]|nr:hypothetical protein evm_012966 [Chilo suppressalis]
MATEIINFTIRNDRHLGHLLFQALKTNPESICQIDVATGEKESKGSMLSRSAQLARSLRKFGLQPKDVLTICGKNHLDLHIPYYAALFNGLPICGVDNSFKYDEVKNVLKVVLPKIAFCDGDSYELFKRVVKDLNLDTTVIRFGNGENSMNEFIDKYDCNAAEEFKVTEYDVNNVYIWLPATSGSTGAVKVAAIKQDQILAKTKIYLQVMAKLIKNIPMSPDQIVLNVGPIHWLTGIYNALSLPLLGHCKLQTSGPANADHLLDIINEYKPAMLLTSPAVLSSLLNHKKHCDFSCFKVLSIIGSKLRQELYNQARTRLPSTSCLINLYGQTETIGLVLCSDPFGSPEAFVMPIKTYETKIVDPESGKELTEPMARGELWIRGALFTEYYRNTEETKKAITEDGFYKTGDIFYKDDADCFYYVERLKVLIKYRNYHVVPAELEELIRKHPSVRDVAVTSVPHAEDGEHPVACVVKEIGANISAKQIIDIVADKLSEGKRLRGGVVFLDEIPLTSTGKVAARKLKQIVLESRREL